MLEANDVLADNEGGLAYGSLTAKSDSSHNLLCR